MQPDSLNLGAALRYEVLLEGPEGVIQQFVEADDLEEGEGCVFLLGRDNNWLGPIGESVPMRRVAAFPRDRVLSITSHPV